MLMELQVEVMQDIIVLNNSTKDYGALVENSKREHANKYHIEMEIKKLETKKKESSKAYTQLKEEHSKRVEILRYAKKKESESQTAEYYAKSEANVVVAKFFTEDLDTRLT